MTRKAYAYVRYSSAIQAKGDSVDRQVSPLTLFSEKFGVGIEEVFVDEGVSSFKGDNIKRGRFKEILEMIENGLISAGDYLVIESIDRISRQALNKTASQLYSILEKGIQIYTTSDEKLYSLEDKSRDLENYLMIGLIAKRANEESEIKSKRRKSAWRKARKLAKEEKKVFSTYQNTPYGLRVENGQFVIVEEEADEIRQLFESLKYVGVSKSIKELNKTAKKKWSHRNVHQLLVNKYVIGTYRAQVKEDGKKVFEENIENYYPQIISESVFYEAVEAMKVRATKTHYGNESTGSLNIFKHCIKCSCCGESMRFYRGKNPKGIQYCYAGCTNKTESSFSCYDQAFRFDYAVGVLLNYLRGLYFYNIEYGLSEKMENATEEEAKNWYMSDILFLDILKKQKTVNKGVESKANELAKAKSFLANLIESVGSFQGRIPSTILKQLGEAEDTVEKLEKEFNLLKVEEKETLNAVDFNQFLDLLNSEKGRQRINRFFKQNGYSFYFEYQKHLGRSLKMTIKRDGVFAGTYGANFSLRHPLKEFGIYNYNDMV